MAEAISWEIREDAKELYVTEGMTYDQVANATGVSVSQLKKWGQVESWTAARKEYREAYASIKRDTVMLRAKLLKTALGSGDPQSVYAFAAIEKAVVMGKSKSDPVQVSAPEKLRDINTPSDAVEALQQVIELKLNKLLSQPDILRLSQVRELKQTMELVDQMKAKYSPDDKKENKTIDAQAIKDIREMLKL